MGDGGDYLKHMMYSKLNYLKLTQHLVLAHRGRDMQLAHIRVGSHLRLTTGSGSVYHSRRSAESQGVVHAFLELGR
jgi:hypothetical protein